MALRFWSRSATLVPRTDFFNRIEYLSGRRRSAGRPAAGVRTALYLRVSTRTRSRIFSMTGFAVTPPAPGSRWSGIIAM
jgi:hypothetical protein